MPATVSLLNMRLRARELADMQTSNQASAFVTDAELTNGVNRHLKQLYNLLIIARGDEYYAATTAFSIVGSNASLPLLVPTFMALLALSATDGRRVVWVPKFNLKQWASLKYQENTSKAGLDDYRYRLMGDNLEVRPGVTNATHSFVLHFIPAFVPLALDGDAFDGVNGWEDWAIYGAAIDMLNKEESLEQAQGLMAQRSQLEQQISKLAGARDAGMPEVVGDTMRDWDNYSQRNRWQE